MDTYGYPMDTYGYPMVNSSPKESGTGPYGDYGVTTI